MSSDPLVTAWIQLQHVKPKGAAYEELFWAFESVDILTRTSPQDAMQFIVAVVSSTESEWVLSNLAAGPIEDLLMRYPEATVDALETECAHNPRLAQVLHGVWLSGLPRALSDRIEQIRSRAPSPPNNRIERPRER